MEIITAKSAGFCYGVNRAVSMAYRLSEERDNICTLGPIIHNEQVVNQLKERGVFPVASLEEVPKGYTVIIRSHGVAQSVYDRLTESGIEFVDATCPFVAKIHSIVRKQSALGKKLIICGDAKHPEIVGICGHATKNSEVVVVKNAKELEHYLQNTHFLSETPTCLAAQTTFQIDEWEKCVKIAKRYCTNIEIFDTICSATSIRQNEAVELSKTCDVMVIVGGKHSSNTAKLKEICSPNCKTMLIETADEIDPKDFVNCDRIGVTAGASTPADIIKEVQDTMSEMEKILTEDATFAEMFEQSLKSVYNGEKVTGVVVGITPTEVRVDIGTKHTGYVTLNEMTEDPNAKIEDLVKVGDSIDLMVLRVNDVEGTVMLSKKRLEAAAGFEKVMDAAGTDEIFEGVVVDAIKGGVLVLTNGVKVFIPASLVTLGRLEDLTTLLKTKVSFKILEANRQRKRAVGSIKAVLLAEKKEKEEAFWSTVEVGKVYTGVVKSLTSYGAFVDLGGVDGMVHISELSWIRIKKPSDVVKVGDTVEVYVKDIDTEKRKISLGYKKIEDNPWEIMKRDYEVGSVCKVKIISMTTFGAFAQIIPGVDGLIHISQISTERIAKPQDVLEIGQEVDAKITELDFDKKRISLSIRALLDDQEVAVQQDAE